MVNMAEVYQCANAIEYRVPRLLTDYQKEGLVRLKEEDLKIAVIESELQHFHVRGYWMNQDSLWKDAEGPRVRFNLTGFGDFMFFLFEIEPGNYRLIEATTGCCFSPMNIDIDKNHCLQSVISVLKTMEPEEMRQIIQKASEKPDSCSPSWGKP